MGETIAFVIFNLLCVAALVGADQTIKFWAVQVLEPVGSMPLIPHGGAAALCSTRAWRSACSAASSCFSFFATGAALCFWWLTGCFSAAVAKVPAAGGSHPVLGGGIGNLIDRVLNGEVVDYINVLFMRFAVFNFADICVCVGVALWCWSSSWKKSRSKES